MMKPELKPIGHVRTPYQAREQCPRNIDPAGPMCQLVVDAEYAQGIEGLESGQPILVLYWFEDVDRNRMVQRRRGQGASRGVFALRSPHRPNPIAAGVVRIERIEGRRIFVRGLDCLDGTPLLDIKPAGQPELDREVGPGPE